MSTLDPSGAIILSLVLGILLVGGFGILCYLGGYYRGRIDEIKRHPEDEL